MKRLTKPIFTLCCLSVFFECKYLNGSHGITDDEISQPSKSKDISKKRRLLTKSNDTVDGTLQHFKNIDMLKERELPPKSNDTVDGTLKYFKYINILGEKELEINKVTYEWFVPSEYKELEEKDRQEIIKSLDSWAAKLETNEEIIGFKLILSKSFGSSVEPFLGSNAP